MSYVATFRLIPVTDVDQTFAEWMAEFEAALEREDGLAQSIGQNVFAAGLRAEVPIFALIYEWFESNTWDPLGSVIGGPESTLCRLSRSAR